MKEQFFHSGAMLGPFSQVEDRVDGDGDGDEEARTEAAANTAVSWVKSIGCGGVISIRGRLSAAFEYMLRSRLVSAPPNHWVATTRRLPCITHTVLDEEKEDSCGEWIDLFSSPWLQEAEWMFFFIDIYISTITFFDLARSF